jgi:hypothetical protein
VTAKRAIFRFGTGMAHATFPPLMATPRAVMSGDGHDGDPETSARVRITDECLELDTLSPTEVRMVRAWIGRMNGSTNIQPYLAEESPGRFCLYIGTAAERARTTKGLQ